MIDNKLLMDFEKILPRRRIHTATSLEEVLIDQDTLNFFNKYNLTFDAPIDVLKAGCILGLFKECLKLEIHLIEGETISSALGIISDQHDTKFARYENWIESETLHDFYKNALPILKTIKLHKLKINAFTIVNDVAMKQSQLDGEDHNKRPLDRFKVREGMLFIQEHPFSEKKITPKMVIEARKTANLTQKQSAELVCVDERTWQRWESGDRAMSKAVYKLYLIETKQI